MDETKAGNGYPEKVNKIDLSSLSADQQVAFDQWLKERPQLQANIKNALHQGQSVKAQFVSLRKRLDYSVRIDD